MKTHHGQKLHNCNECGGSNIEISEMSKPSARRGTRFYVDCLDCKETCAGYSLKEVLNIWNNKGESLQ